MTVHSIAIALLPFMTYPVGVVLGSISRTVHWRSSRVIGLVTLLVFCSPAPILILNAWERFTWLNPNDPDGLDWSDFAPFFARVEGALLTVGAIGFLIGLLRSHFLQRPQPAIPQPERARPGTKRAVDEVASDRPADGIDHRKMRVITSAPTRERVPIGRLEADRATFLVVIYLMLFPFFVGLGVISLATQPLQFFLGASNWVIVYTVALIPALIVGIGTALCGNRRPSYRATTLASLAVSSLSCMLVDRVLKIHMLQPVLISMTLTISVFAGACSLAVSKLLLRL